MDKEIVFGGQTTTPSDYESPDGDLQLSLNVINEYGSLHPVSQPVKSDIVEDGIPIFIHKSTTFSTPHVIIQTSEGLKWRLSNSSTVSLITGTNIITSVVSINSLGNWLILSSGSSIHYILFKDNDYQYKGTRVPTPQVELAPCRINSGIMDINKHLFTTSEESVLATDIGLESGTDYASSVNETSRIRANKVDVATDTIMSLLGGMEKRVRQSGLFLYPRLVRFAVKMYTGNYINITEPVLVYCTQSTEFAKIDLDTNRIYTSCLPFTLDYYIKNLEDLKKWDDIIIGIGVFASSEVYDYDPNGKVATSKAVSMHEGSATCNISIFNLPAPTRFIQDAIADTHDYFHLYDIDIFAHSNFNYYYQVDIFRKFSSIGSMYAPTSGTVSITYQLEGSSAVTKQISYAVNQYTYPELISAIKNCLITENLHVVNIYSNANIFKLKNGSTSSLNSGAYCHSFAIIGAKITSFSIVINDASSDGTFADIVCNRHGGCIIPPEDIELDSLETHNTIQSLASNSTIGLSTFNARCLTNYNSRQIYADITVTPYHADCTPRFFGYREHSISNQWFIIRNGKGTSVIKASVPSSKFSLDFVYYPSIDCKQCVIKLSGRYYTIRLEESKYEESCIKALAPMFPVCKTCVSVGRPMVGMQIDQTTNNIDAYLDNSITEDPVENIIVTEKQNLVITSDAMDPFSWSSINEQTVGTGRIIGLATAAKPLSQGQSGQFPLYCFTDTEGVYSMSVSSDGTLMPGQPILQEVPVSTGSIASLDDSVIFATSRGIIELTGSSQQVISSDLYLRQSSTSPFSASILASVPHITSFSSGDLVDVLSLHNMVFADFIEDARFVYDYNHQRIYIFSDTFSKDVFVYSRNTNRFSMLYLKDMEFKRTINAYPEPLFVGKHIDPEGSTDDIRIFSLGSINAYCTEPQTLTSTPIDIVLLTRPLHLDARDIYKTVSSLIVRGSYNEGSLGAILYGSNDLKHWFVIKSTSTSYLRNAHGSPYKYFRILIAGKLDKYESVFSSQVTYSTRLMNKPR